MIQKLRFEELIQEPSCEEYSIAAKIAEENPEFLDDRDIWILNHFNRRDFDE